MGHSHFASRPEGRHTPIKFGPPHARGLVIRSGALFAISGNACVRLRHKTLAAWLLDAGRSGRHPVSASALGASHLALGRHLMALALQPHQQPSIPSLLAAAEGGSISVCSPGMSLSLPPSPLIAADECTRAYALRYAMQHLSLALSFSAKAEDSADGVIGKAAGSAPGQAEEAGSGGHAPGRAEEAGKLLMSGVASWDLIGRVFEAGYGVDAVHALDRAVRLLGSPTPRSLPPLPPHTAGSIACNDEAKQPASSAQHPSASAAAAASGISADDSAAAASGISAADSGGASLVNSSGNDEDGGFSAYLCEALRWLRLCFDEFEARPTELEAITLRLCPVR